MTITPQQLTKHQAVQDQFWMDAEGILRELKLAADGFRVAPPGPMNSPAGFALEMVIREVMLRQGARELGLHNDKETGT